MARSLVRHTVRTDTGQVVISAKVEPLLEGTTTAITDAYPTETGGSAATSFLTNAQGEVVFWMDTYRDQIDLRVSANGTAYLPGSSATLFSFGTFTETVAVPALGGAFAADADVVKLAGAQTVTGAKTFNTNTLLDKGSEVFNVKAYGATGDGVTNDTTAVQAAIDAAKVAGGVVFFPAGTYITTASLNMAGAKAVTLLGTGCRGTTNGALGSVINYTPGDANPVINAKSSFYCIFDQLHITYTSRDYTGNVMDFSHNTPTSSSDSTGITIQNCTIGGDGTSGANCLINFRSAILSRVTGCLLGRAQSGIRFRYNEGASVSYSNAHLIQGNIFIWHKWALMNFGESISVIGNWFEGTGTGETEGTLHETGMRSAYRSDITTDVISTATLWIGNWHGDAYPPRLANGWIDLGTNESTHSWHVAGNLFAVGAYVMKFTKVSDAFGFYNNHCANITTAVIDFGTGTTWRGVVIQGNHFGNTATPLVNSGNHKQMVVMGNSGDNSTNDLLTIQGHIVTERAGGVQPTITAGVNLGSGGTAEIFGNDVAGQIDITPSSAPGAGQMATVTFAKPFGSHSTQTPKILLSPANATAARDVAKVHTLSVTNSGFEIHSAEVPTASLLHRYFYMIVQ